MTNSTFVASSNMPLATMRAISTSNPAISPFSSRKCQGGLPCAGADDELAAGENVLELVGQGRIGGSQRDSGRDKRNKIRFMSTPPCYGTSQDGTSRF